MMWCMRYMSQQHASISSSEPKLCHNAVCSRWQACSETCSDVVAVLQEPVGA